MCDYYTYAYLRKDRTPYYVGRGKGNRYKQKHQNVKVPPKDRIIFLKKNLTFSESVKHEVYMIAVLGRKLFEDGGILRNITVGGEGHSAPHTLKARKKMSQSHKGKRLTEEHKLNIGLSQRGKIVSLETREKLKQTRAKQTPPTLGQKRTPEQRERMKQGALNRWAKQRGG